MRVHRTSARSRQGDRAPCSNSSADRHLAPAGAIYAVAVSLLFMPLAIPALAADMVESKVAYTGYDMDFLRDVNKGTWRDKSRQLSGQLYMPKSGGRHPVVIVQHGSGSPDHRDYRAWKSDLRDALLPKGIGMFIADSYTGRGISETSKNQGQLSRASRTVDALMALSALSARADVDPSKIGIVGFSFGGSVANLTSNEGFVSQVLPKGSRFAAHVAVYPACGGKFERHQPTGAPVLMLLGGADDYTNPAFCTDSAEGMRGNGAKVELVTFDGAHHGFISTKPVYWNEGAWTFDDCGRQIIGSDGEERDARISSEGKSWVEFTRFLAKACGRKGVHIGTNEKAAAGALQRTVAFFAEHLRK